MITMKELQDKIGGVFGCDAVRTRHSDTPVQSCSYDCCIICENTGEHEKQRGDSPEKMDGAGKIV